MPVKTYLYLNNLTIEETEKEIQRINEGLISSKKRLQDGLIKLSEKVNEWDMKRLERNIKEQANDTKLIADFQQMLIEANESLQEKKQQEEANKPEYATLKSFVETWKQEEIKWFQNKYDTNDRTQCTKEDKKLLNQGMEYIINFLEVESQIRLQTLINQLKDRVGEVVKCELKRNVNNGFDGLVKGEKGTVQIETILAGGYNIQRLHYRTLFK